MTPGTLSRESNKRGGRRLSRDDLARSLHDRATRGAVLSAEEQAQLDAWYAQLDQEEAALLSGNRPAPGLASLQAQVDAAVARIEPSMPCDSKGKIMPATTVGIDEAAYQRLLHLVEQTGRPAGVILEQALAEYEHKVAGSARPVNGLPQPAAAEEAELLDDVGRIRMPPRDRSLIAARIVAVPLRVPRLALMRRSRPWLPNLPIFPGIASCAATTWNRAICYSAARASWSRPRPQRRAT